MRLVSDNDAYAEFTQGYHFWCPVAPVPIFDRLLHDAVKRVRSRSNVIVNFHEVSDVALGFRSIFGTSSHSTTSGQELV